MPRPTARYACARWQQPLLSLQNRSAEGILAPGLEHGDRHGVRQIQAALAFSHRQAQALRRRDRIAHSRRESTGFGAEDQPVTGPEILREDAALAPGAQGEDTPGHRPFAVQQCAPVHMAAHRRVLVVVQPGASQLPVVHVKAQRLDQMQRTAGVGCQADHIAGVGRNFRRDQNDMEHRRHCPPVWRRRARATARAPAPRR